ncbi:MAG: ABC transporter permease subunit [Candidatus Goldbacteria bacterium]|nr:ABC transporter permease subunit [Candidatus Goldiibacteriota bacterium]
MRRIAAVAEYIFKQSFRNKILNVLIMFAVFGIGFALVISELAQEVEVKMVTDFGLFAIGLFGFLTLALSITVQMFEETELKTLSMILVKPVSRLEYLTGKYAGIVLTILMNVLLMLAALMAIIQIKGGDPWSLKLLTAAGLIFISLAVLASTALLLSIISTSVPGAVIFLFFVYILGHLTIHLKYLSENINNTAVNIVINIFYYLIPNLELFNLKDKIFSPSGLFSAQYLGLTLLYAALYSAATLMAAAYFFEKKEY